jgi:tetratricopeptide (TPR) repeat protein
MRRIAILFIGLLAALPAFSQAPAGAAGATGAPKGPHPKSNAENNAVLAMFKTPDPDGQIKAAEDLLKTYPDTDYKPQAWLVEAQAYNDKRDYPKAKSFGEQSLDADPTSFTTLLLLADVYSRSAKSTDLDLNDSLAKVDKYAKQALTLLATARKPKEDLPDEDWEAAKKGQESSAWLSLGFAAVLSKKFDDAKTDFQKGIDLSPNPLEMLYIERAYGDAKRYDDAIAWSDKAASAPNVPANLKQIAGNDKTRFQALKAKQ